MRGERKPVNHDSIDLEDQHMEDQHMEDSLSSKNDHQKTEWRDVSFAIVFYLSLFIMTFVGVYWISQIDNEHDTDFNEPILSFQIDVAPIAGGIASAIFFAFAWLLIVYFCAEYIIKAVLVLVPIVMVMMAVISAVAGSVFVCIMLLIFAAFRAWYAWAIWSRIEFATACLKVGLKILQEFSSPIFVNFACGIIACIVVGIDSMVLYGMANVVQSAGVSYCIIFWLFIAYYWHIVVCFNVAHVTSCGVAGSFLLNKVVEDNAVCKSLGRALTYSFGSICFGALVEAVIRAVLAMLREAERQNNSNACLVVALCILRCIVNLIQNLVEYFNSYAFVYVALYGESYLDSAKAVWQAAKSKGMEALINDDLSGLPLRYGAYFVLFLTILISWAIGGWNLNMIISAMCGLVIYMCVVYTVISYIKTFFVVWINDPAEMRKCRPEEFGIIVKASGFSGYDNTEWAR